MIEEVTKILEKYAHKSRRPWGILMHPDALHQLTDEIIECHIRSFPGMGCCESRFPDTVTEWLSPFGMIHLLTNYAMTKDEIAIVEILSDGTVHKIPLTQEK